MSVYNDEFIRLRGCVDWGQKETADRLGLHPTVIWKYENNKAVPSITVLRLFSLLSGFPLTVPGEERMSLNDRARYLTPWEEEVVAVLRPVDAETRKLLIQALRALVEAAFKKRAPRRGKGASDHPPDPIPSGEQLIRAFAGDIISDAVRKPSSAVVEKSSQRPPRSAAAASAERRPQRLLNRDADGSAPSSKSEPD